MIFVGGEEREWDIRKKGRTRIKYLWMGKMWLITYMVLVWNGCIVS